MNPTYRAGYLRHFALDEITRLEERIARRERGEGKTKGTTKITPSVSLGQLGPPELGKLLWEAHLLKLRYGTLTGVLEEESAETISQKLFSLVQSDEVLRRTIVSVGLPILTPDGKSLIRGPVIRIPEIPNVNKVNLTKESVDKWARKGWVDLRPANMKRWQERFKTMLRETHGIRGRGSAAITREAYLTEEISIGAVVGWIFNNEEGGYRIK
jgi:hypothetical protein